MTNPFKIDGPTCLSFSGGRTSAYMLWLTIQANSKEAISRWLKVCFANTGLEAEETLKFVERCSVEWDVPIRWLEYTDDEEKRFRAVNYLWAARLGEPFEALIRRRKFLPNPVSRFCTSELKIRTMHRYLRYFFDWPEWDQFIGIRADEQRRVSKIRARGHSTETRDETMCMPLANAGIGIQEVDTFWKTQPFKLELTVENGRTLDGNCVYCFLKPPAQRLSLARQGKYPMTWWVRAEDGSMVPGATGAGARFTKDGPSYEQIERYAKEQHEMFDADEEALACFCGD